MKKNKVQRLEAELKDKEKALEIAIVVISELLKKVNKLEKRK